MYVDELIGDLLTTQEAADLLGAYRTRVNQYSRENRLVIIQRDDRAYVPAGLLEELPEPVESATHQPLENLRGTITLLRDSEFSAEEIAEWLWTPDEELGTTPIAALREGRHHQVNRIASAL